MRKNFPHCPEQAKTGDPGRVRRHRGLFDLPTGPGTKLYLQPQDEEELKCGPDITGHLLHLERYITAEFKAMPTVRKKMFCDGRFDVKHGWDICELAWKKNVFCKRHKHDGSCHQCYYRDFKQPGNLDERFRRETRVGVAKCDGTVTVGQNVCMKAEGANYFLWGLISRLCEQAGHMPSLSNLSYVLSYRDVFYFGAGIDERVCGFFYGYGRYQDKNTYRWRKVVSFPGATRNYKCDKGVEECIPCKASFRGFLSARIRMEFNDEKFALFATMDTTQTRFTFLHWRMTEEDPRPIVPCPPQ